MKKDRQKAIPCFSGTCAGCGAAYSRFYQAEIAGFYCQELAAYKYSKRFIKSCMKKMQSQAPNAAAFIRGAARNSLLAEEQHVLLLLHEEELYHRKLLKKKPHCSAVGVAPKTGRSGAILGQNWDWSTAYYRGISFNRFKIRGFPQVAALSFPGLPVCAGLNSEGLCLMWTGAGYYPPLIPEVGVPTYALVFEALLQEDVPGVLDYLLSVCNAGAFIFVLGDKAGNLAVAEGVPGKVFVKRCTAVHRANVFELPRAVALSRQKLPSESKCHSIIRNRTFRRTFNQYCADPSLGGVKRVLSQRNILVERSYSHATLVQLAADCGKGELLVRCWRQKERGWKVIAV